MDVNIKGFTVYTYMYVCMYIFWLLKVSVYLNETRNEWFVLCNMLHRKDRTGQAVELLNRAVAVEKAEPFLYVNRGG